jgi:hypothetical protein
MAEQEFINIMKQQSNIKDFEVLKTPDLIDNQIDMETVYVKITGIDSTVFNLILTKKTFLRFNTTETINLWNNYLNNSSKNDYCAELCGICESLEPFYFLDPKDFILHELRETEKIVTPSEQQQILIDKLIETSFINNINIFNISNRPNSIFISCEVDYKNNPVANTKVSSVIDYKSYSSDENIDILIENIQKYYTEQIVK